MSLKEYLGELRNEIEIALNEYLPPPETLPRRLHEAMRYSTLAGGKRLRPCMAVMACEAVGGDRAAALPFAVGLEMIHSYSLIHDDLPCMDDDDLRRGRPANHIVFGESTALLAGDALLTLAFEVVLKTAGVDADRVLRAAAELAAAAGSRGMVGGQVLDLEGEGKNLSLEEIRRIHRLKTGALFTAAVVGGGILGGGSREEIKALRRYGEYFGMAFQITDDILDLTATADRLGKNPGSDVKSDKSTYPRLLGLDGARSEARKAATAAREALEPFGREGEKLAALAELVLTRDS